MTTTTSSGVSVIVLISILCVGLAMMLVGGWYFQSSLVELKSQQQVDWYFQSSLVELKTQQQETVKLVQQLQDTVERQNKQIIELQFQLQQVNP